MLKFRESNRDGAKQRNIARHGNVHNRVKHNAAEDKTTQHNTTQHNTTQHNTTQPRAA